MDLISAEWRRRAIEKAQQPAGLAALSGLGALTGIGIGAAYEATQPPAIAIPELGYYPEPTTNLGLAAALGAIAAPAVGAGIARFAKMPIPPTPAMPTPASAAAAEIAANRRINTQIEKLEPNQVFVFGSNTEGRHGAGAAKLAAQKFGAQYGNPSGLQGQSYAIVTKDLKGGQRSVSLEQITQQMQEFAGFAKNTPDKEFLLTPIGTGLGGYSTQEMQEAIKGIQFPQNVVFVNW